MQTTSDNEMDTIHQQTWNGSQQPQYAPQQNGPQMIVNLPPQQSSSQPEPNFNPNNQHMNDTLYVPVNTDDNPALQPFPMPTNNNPYPHSPNNDDQPSGHPGEKYKIGEANQPSEQHGVPEPQTSGGTSKMDKTIKKAIGSLFLFFTGANLAILIALLVFHFGKKHVSLSSGGGALGYIGFNLNQHPIMDVIVKDEGTSCPTDYYSIMLGAWPGTVAGCDCPITGLEKGTCGKLKYGTALLCSNIDPRSSIDMYNWGGSNWCVKRAKLGTDYTKTVDCEAGFKKCSPGICILSALACPVTKVKFDTTGTYKLKLGTDRYVVTENTQGQSPVIDLAITPNDIPCFNEDYFASGMKSPYMLIDENEKGCSKYGLDSQYSFELDRQTQDKLFSQNSFPSKVMNLPDYDDTYEKTNSILSYRVRMDVAENNFCLNIDTSLLEKSSKAAEDLNRWMSRTSKAAMIIHGMLLLFMGVVAWVARSREFRKDMFDKKLSRWVIPCGFWGLLEFIVLIVMFAATKHYRALMITTQEYFVKMTEIGCFLGTQPQAAVNDYQVAVDDVAGTLYKYSIALFLINLICCILPCICLFVRFRGKEVFFPGGICRYIRG